MNNIIFIDINKICILFCYN